MSDSRRKKSNMSVEMRSEISGIIQSKKGTPDSAGFHAPGYMRNESIHSRHSSISNNSRKISYFRALHDSKSANRVVSVKTPVRAPQ